MDKKNIIISYSKTDTDINIGIANEYWQLFQDTLIKGGGDDYQIIFEDYANPIEQVDSNFKQI